MSAEAVERSPAPSRRIRLLCWFGLYLAAQLLDIPMMGSLAPFFFPTGLGIAVTFTWLIPNDSHFAFSENATPFVIGAWCTVGWAIYIWNFRAVMRAKTCRRVTGLLLIFVVLLLINDWFWPNFCNS
jgi:hypothetical protein